MTDGRRLPSLPIHARDLPRLTRERRLPKVLDETLDALHPWIPSASAAEFVNAIGSGRSRTSADQGARSVLVQGARAFHERAGTMTAGVQNTLDAVAEGRGLRLSHQPNFAAYCKLAALFPALATIAATSNQGPVYVFNDYDSVTDKRFSRARWPSPLKSIGYYTLGLPVRGNSHAMPAFTVSKPSSEWVAQTGRRIATLSVAEPLPVRMDRTETERRVSDLIADLEEAHALATTMTDMTAMLLSRIVNVRLSLPVAFVPGSLAWRIYGLESSFALLEIWPHLMENLYEMHAKLAAGGVTGLPRRLNPEVAPYWWLCDCNWRTALYVGADGSSKEWRTDCRHCRQSEAVTVSVGRLDELRGRLLPRVGMQNLTISASYGFRGGVTYTSGAGHSIAWGLAGESAGVAMLPQLFLDPRFDLPATWRTGEMDLRHLRGAEPAEAMIADGYGTSLYSLSRLGHERFRHACATWVATNVDAPIRCSNGGGRHAH